MSLAQNPVLFPPQGTEDIVNIVYQHVPPQGKISGRVPWFDINWLNRKKWTVDNTNVSGTSTITEFPVALVVTDTDLSKARADGFDFVVTSSDGTTEIPYDRTRWDDTTGKLTMFFKEDILTTKNTIGYIYYNNASQATDKADPTNVWDSNYDRVLHFNVDEVPQDSTSNSYHADSKTGVVFNLSGGTLRDGAVQGDGIDDNIQFTNMTNLQSNPFTFSFWITRLFDVDNEFDRVLGVGGGSDFEIAAGDDHDLQVYNGLWADTTIDITKLTLHKIDIVRENATSWKHYHNGVIASTVSPGSTSVSSNFLTLFDKGGGGENLNYILDEFRISTIARSVDYILTNYNNELADGTFTTLGSEEDV